MEAWKEELYHYGVKGMKWGKHKWGTMNAEQGRNAEVNYRRLNGMVNNTLKGNYGNEAERQRRLGVNYRAVQSEVNRRKLGRDATPGNYAKDNTKYSSEDWSRTLKAQRAQRNINARRAENRRVASGTKSTSSSSSSKGKSGTKMSSYDRGYAFAQRFLKRRKR